VSSLCIEHVMLLQDSGAFWAARPRWQHGQVWRAEASGEPLAACASLLAQAPRGRLRYLDRISVLLGFPHVHYWMLAWQPGLFSQADWQGFAQATFNQQTGIDPVAWQVQVADAGFGQPRLAVATPLDLLADLRALFKLKALPLAACTPLLTTTLAHYRAQLPADCVLAVPEPNALGCLYVQQGVISQVCLMQTAPQASLSDGLFSAQLLTEQPQAPTFVVTPRPVADAGHWLGPAHPWLLEPNP